MTDQFSAHDMATAASEGFRAGQGSIQTVADGRWYMVNKDGMATLCTDRADAEKEAADAQSVWPHMGPHRAVQLVEAADAQQENFDHGPQATSIEEAARDVGKWLNERPNRPIDLRHVAMLCAHAHAAQEAQEPVAWYVTGGSRLLDEDEAKAEARHIGGTARAIPLYTAPQADSVTAPAAGAVAHTISDAQIEAMPVWRNFVGLWPESRREIVDAVVDLLAAAPTQAADSVLEDAARYRFLAGHCRSTSEHWGGRWSIIIDGPAPKSHDSEDDFDEAVDAARKQGANHD